MVFNRFRFLVLLRLILIVGTAIVAAYVYSIAYWVTFANLTFLTLVQIVWLFRYLTQWQKDIAIVGNAVRHGDYSFHFNIGDTNHPLYNFYTTLNHITQHVRDVQSQAEEQNQYFDYILNNAQVGLTIYDGSGKILLVNDEFKRLAGVELIGNIEALKRSSEILFTHLQTMALNRPQLIVDKDNNIKLSARLSKIIVRERPLYIVSLINISPELEENELKSWQELMSILTHEIMNSIAPIHSLNGTMSKYLDRITGNEEIVAKAKSNLDVINRRSGALMDFVDRYRKISTVPLPNLQNFAVRPLIDDVVTLLQDDLKNIQFNVRCDDEHIYADRNQVEQVMINLLKNALYAVEGVALPSLDVMVSREDGGVVIQVRDNGKGIPREISEKIFMPFFTTRPSGSGIGLTISRQIMQRHHGSIRVTSAPNAGTTFTLTFPARR